MSRRDHPGASGNVDFLAGVHFASASLDCACLTSSSDIQRAAVVLGHWGYDWTRIQEPLLEALRDDSELRYGASNVIELREEDAAPAAEPLTKLATSEEEDKSTRDAAIRALGALSHYVASTRQTVVKLLSKEDKHYSRIQMVQSLAGDGHGGEVMDSILAELKATKSEEAAHLLSALQGIDPGQVDAAKFAGQLQPFLDSSDTAVKQEAALTLAHFHAGSDAVAAIAIKLLDSDDRDERQNAIQAIQALGPQAKSAVPKLIEMLDDPEVCYQAIEALGEIGPDAASSTAKLVSLIGDNQLFSSAARALGKIGPSAAEAVPALLAQFGSEQRMALAARALAKIQPETVPPALYAHLKFPNLRYAALEAIAELEKDAAPAIPVLLKALARDDVELKLSAINTLGRLKEVGSSAVKDLLPYLTSEDEDLRRATAWALGSIKSQPDICISALLPALDHSDWQFQIQAARALGNFKAGQAVEPMRKWLADPKLKGTAIDTLREIGPEAKTAAPDLLKVVAEEGGQESEPVYLRQSALDALVAIGPDAATVAPELVKLQKNAGPEMRRKIGLALWKIAPSEAKEAGIPEPAKDSNRLND